MKDRRIYFARYYQEHKEFLDKKTVLYYRNHKDKKRIWNKEYRDKKKLEKIYK